MTPDEITSALKLAETPPSTVLKAGLNRADELAPLVYAIADKFCRGVYLLPEENALLFYGLHILAAARHPKLLDHLMAIARQPYDELEHLFPDHVVDKYPQFYWNRTSPHIQAAIGYLNVTSSRRRWIAGLYSNVFRAERELLGRLVALEDATGIAANATIHVRDAGSVADQQASFRSHARPMTRGSYGARPTWPIVHGDCCRMRRGQSRRASGRSRARDAKAASISSPVLALKNSDLQPDNASSRFPRLSRWSRHWSHRLD